MGIKWKEDYRAETQRKFGLWIGFIAGATSAWIIYGIYTSWSMLKNAPWWEVMTAFGTVGAVTASVGIAYWLEEKRRKQARQDGAFLIAGARNRIGILMASLYQLQKKDADLDQNNLQKEYDAIRNIAMEALTTLDSVPISIAADFDRVYASNLIAAKSQLHVVISTPESEFVRKITSQAAIGKINDCVKRTERADEHIKRITMAT